MHKSLITDKIKSVVMSKLQKCIGSIHVVCDVMLTEYDGFFLSVLKPRQGVLSRGNVDFVRETSNLFDPSCVKDSRVYTYVVARAASVINQLVTLAIKFS